MTGIRDIVEANRSGTAIGITSICSAHPLVIEATFAHAKARDLPIVLIEATSNQVNQDGGYTGMQPADFRAFVESIAAKVGFPAERIVLGGDHLGPNTWTALPSAEAMAKAEVMVAAYVAAGFRKIHLDCSMSCQGDPFPLDDATIAARAVQLAKAAEASFTGAAEDAPLYVIGTEVPVPGGAAEELDELAPTTPEAALTTVDIHRDAFAAAGLGDAWSRVIATVVQPGVEFDHDKVVDYQPEKARDLSRAIERADGIVYEAHSTDYQTGDALAALVRDHFAILKVGPGVTFALREALWALAAMEGELLPPENRSNLRAVALERMHAEPGNWRKYYHAEGHDLELQLQYSLSDRIRYYWPDSAIAAAQDKLFANLRAANVPLALLSQYLPTSYAALRSGTITSDPADLVQAHIGATLDLYHGACRPNA